MKNLFKHIEETLPLVLEHKADSQDVWKKRWAMIKEELLNCQVHIICCNDSVVAAVIGTLEVAEQKAKEVKNDYIEKTYQYLDNKGKDEKAELLFYHVHTVDLF